MVAVLIACGGNSLEIPCRVFENLEAGKKRCNEIFGFEPEVNKSGALRYKIDLESKGNDPDNKISEELFTCYYYGCGGPYVFVLMEVSFDTKFVGFDLD